MPLSFFKWIEYMAADNNSVTDITQAIYKIFYDIVKKGKANSIKSLLKGCVFLEATVNLGLKLVTSGKDEQMHTFAGQMASLWVISNLHKKVDKIECKELEFIDNTYNEFIKILDTYKDIQEPAEFYLDKTIRSFWVDIINSEFYKKVTDIPPGADLVQVVSKLKKQKGGEIIIYALIAFLVGYNEHKGFSEFIDGLSQQSDR